MLLNKPTNSKAIVKIIFNEYRAGAQNNSLQTFPIFIHKISKISFNPSVKVWAGPLCPRRPLPPCGDSAYDDKACEAEGICTTEKTISIVMSF